MAGANVSRIPNTRLLHGIHNGQLIELPTLLYEDNKRNLNL